MLRIHKQTACRAASSCDLAIRYRDSRGKKKEVTVQVKEDTPECLDQSSRGQLRQRTCAPKTVVKREQSVVDISSDSESSSQGESSAGGHSNEDEEVDKSNTDQETAVIHRRRRELKSGKWAQGSSSGNKRRRVHPSPDFDANRLGRWGSTVNTREEDDEDTWGF